MDHYFKPTALRDLKKLPKPIQKRIIRKLDFYTNSFHPLEFAESLKDTSLGQYRFRVGDYRIIFDVVKGKLIILTLGHRRDIYK